MRLNIMQQNDLPINTFYDNNMCKYIIEFV